MFILVCKVLLRNIEKSVCVCGGCADREVKREWGKGARISTVSTQHFGAIEEEGWIKVCTEADTTAQQAREREQSPYAQLNTKPHQQALPLMMTHCVVAPSMHLHCRHCCVK